MQSLYQKKLENAHITGNWIISYDTEGNILSKEPGSFGSLKRKEKCLEAF